LDILAAAMTVTFAGFPLEDLSIIEIVCALNQMVPKFTTTKEIYA
jgi:hypothetical protein